jgi:hypothetical protein
MRGMSRTSVDIDQTQSTGKSRCVPFSIPPGLPACDAAIDRKEQ